MAPSGNAGSVKRLVSFSRVRPLPCDVPACIQPPHVPTADSLRLVADDNNSLPPLFTQAVRTIIIMTLAFLVTMVARPHFISSDRRLPPCPRGDAAREVRK